MSCSSLIECSESVFAQFCFNEFIQGQVLSCMAIILFLLFLLFPGGLVCRSRESSLLMSLSVPSEDFGTTAKVLGFGKQRYV